MTTIETDLTNLDDGRQQLTVSVPWEDVAADYDDTVAEYRKLVVPGFRPGKAPASVVKRHFAKEIDEDFVARCAERLSRSILEEKDVTPAERVAVVEHDTHEGDSFSFKAEFLPLPDFVLPGYTAIPLRETDDDARRDAVSTWLLDATTVEISDSLVEEELAFDDTPSAPDSPEWEEARRRVALLLILRKIARQDGIEIGDDAVDARARQIADESGMRLDQVMTELRQKGGVRRLREMLLAEATLDYLLEVNEKSQ